MNPARQLIADAHREGASFHLLGERLRLVPVDGRALPPDLVARAKALRSDVLAILSSPDRVANFATLDERPANDSTERNREAQRAGLTDRWCDCGSLASFAWPIGHRREVWRCMRCSSNTTTQPR